MPYIERGAKERIEAWGGRPETVGELTYVVYKAALEYFKRSDRRYADHAEVIAALEAAKLEFYRRHVAPYENGAIERNGDVI